MYTLNPQQLELYHKLQAFSFDPPGASKTFAQRLALEQNWTAEYTERVLLEYRRFLLMSTCAGHPITPSHAVDEAWHLHLTYTVSYWHNLCRDTLDFELHHHPGTGLEQPSNFVQQYQRTLESYQRLFWETPPSDIWPDPGGISEVSVGITPPRASRIQGNRIQGNAAGGCLGFLGVLGVGVFMGLNLLATSAFLGFGVMVASFFAAVYVSNLLGGPAWASSSNNSSSAAGSCSSSDGSSFSDSGGDSGGNGGGDSGGSSDGGGSSCGSSCGGGCSS